MTTIYQPFTEYRTDGIQRQFTFGFPYLSRSHVMVTRDGGAPALFRWIDDHTVDVHTLFNEPIPDDEPLKIFRQTPDLDAFAEFKDAALMTKDDLNRARLQVLYLIQERSGGIAGSVSVVVQTLTNEIETLSGALDSLSYSQGQLLSGLQTLGDLSVRMEAIEDGQTAVQQLIDDTVSGLNGTVTELNQRMDEVETKQDNLQSAVTSQINTLVGNDLAFASRVDTVEAKVDAIDLSGLEGDTGEDTDIIAAAVITSAIAEAKSHYAQAKQLEVLQAQIGENLAQVIEQMQASVALVDGKVATVSANYGLKVLAQRQDGRPVMAGIGLNATSSSDYTGSEIILAAERLLFVDTSNPNGTLKPMFTAGNVDGSPTFIIPANVMGDRAYPGRLLVDGSIEGRSVAANTITGDKLKAGSITAREIDVNLGVNLMPNSSFADSQSNVPSGYGIGGAIVSNGWTAPYMDAHGAANVLTGGHTFSFHSSVGDGNQDMSVAAYIASPFIPIVGGSRYEFSVYAGSLSCATEVYIDFWDGSGTTGLGGSNPNLPECRNVSEAPGGNKLTDYKRIGGFITAPANAGLVRMVMRKGQAPSGQSYGFFTCPMIAEAKPNQTRLSPYGISGLGTKITPGGISTPSLSALTANIGLLVSYWPDGGRVERDGNGTRIYAPNGVMVVQLGRW